MSTNTVIPRILGGEVSDDALRADLERYREMALEAGASDAAIVPAEWISVDERVRLKCLVPRCLRAGETPNCPPNAPDLNLVRRALDRFSWAILLKCDVGPIEEYAPGAGKTKEEKRRTLSFHRASAKWSASWRARRTRTAITWPWVLEGVPARTICARGSSANTWTADAAASPTAPGRPWKRWASTLSTCHARWAGRSMPW